MHSSLSIEIAAPCELVFRLARDPLRWPALLPHYVRAEPLEREPDGAVVATFVARRPLVPLLGLGLPVAWRSRTWAEPETMRLRFRHRGGATHGMNVTWHFEALPGGCRLSIEHDFQPRVLLIAMVVERLFVHAIAGRTLRTFKALAEALVDDIDPDRAAADADGPSDA